MKVLFLTILVWLAFAVNTDAQLVKYRYDASGNQISREKTIVFASLSGQGSDDAVTNIENPFFEDIFNERKITIYPNPTKGMLRIDITGDELPSDAMIFIYNSSGSTVRQMNKITESNIVDISSQPAGVYIMRVVLDKKIISTWKIIKE